MYGLVFCVILYSLITVSVSLPISTNSQWNVIPSYSSQRALPNNAPNYYLDGKWPAYGLDAPANYFNYGKTYNDAWLMPPNVPRWYNQPDGTLFHGTSGYLRPPFYDYPANYNSFYRYFQRFCGNKPVDIQ